MRTFVLLLILACSLVTHECVAGSPEVLTQAIAISDHGQVTGYLGQGTFVPISPFLWERGVFTDLDPQRAWSWAFYNAGLDVNTHGEVVGSACHVDQILRPLLLDHGQITDLLGSKPGFAAAVAINNRRQVVGIVFEGVGGFGFLWDNGQLTELGPCNANPDAQAPTYGYGMAINDRGEVVGTVGDSSFLWRKGLRTELDFAAISINDRGQIVGNSGPYYNAFPSTSRAYVWEDGTRTDLGTLGGTWASATGINDKGQIAGLSETATGERHAFFWEEGHMIDLGPASDVEGINARGQIVGHRFYGFPSRWIWDHGTTTFIAEDDSSFTLFPGPHIMLDDRGRVAYNLNHYPGAYTSYFWSDGESVPLVPSTASGTELVEALAGQGRAAGPMKAGAGATDVSTGSVTFALASANPFSGSAMLRYQLPRSEHVVIDVFDIRGTRVRALVDEWQSAGTRLGSWDGADASGRATPPGLYFARLRVGAETRTVRLVRGR